MRNEKLMSQLDADGYFVAATYGDESPLEPGVFLVPGGAVDAEPPVVPEGQRAKWVGEWVLEDIPQPEPEPEPEAATPRMNINTASFDEIITLSGIGPVRSQAVIDGRPWASINDLPRIEGISQAMVDGWADYITTEGS